MSQVIDFEIARGQRDEPDPEFVLYDEDGVAQYQYSAIYKTAGFTVDLHLWARDFSHAEQQVADIRASLELVGQVIARPGAQEATSLEQRLAGCLADCIDTTLLTVRDTINDRSIELRLGSFNRELGERAAELLEEAGL